MLFKKRKYNVVVFGADGMLGYDVVKCLEKLQLSRSARIGVVTSYGKKIDISNFQQVYSLLEHFTYDDNIKYDVVVNCAAMTDVNKIENDKQYRDKAYRANVVGPTYLAEMCKRLKMKLVHVSTDYVFSEKSAQDWRWPVEHHKYDERHAFRKNNSVPWPVNIYGMQKLLAEQAIQKTLPQKQYAILRTSWLYGMHSSKSFVHKFLKNFLLWKADAGLREDSKFTLPDDQASVPTSTEELATMVCCTIQNSLHGVLPACGFYDSALGCSNYAPSWFKFGQYILYAYDQSLVEDLAPTVADDPSKPKFSRMLNVPPDMHEKFYGRQFPLTWTDRIRNFIINNKQELDKWLESQGCFGQKDAEERK